MAKFYLNPSKAVWYTPFQTGGKQPSRQGEIFQFLKEMSINFVEVLTIFSA